MISLRGWRGLRGVGDWAGRRRLCALGALTAGLGLSACSSLVGAPLPPVQWVRLPAQAAGVQPLSAEAMAAQAAAAQGRVWQLMLPVPLPGHLDRDALLLPQGAAGLQPLGEARWAEPLRDAVPRLLRQDLADLLGPAAVWSAPLPPGLAPTHQLRIEFTRFDVAPGASAVQAAARWSVARLPQPGSPPEPPQVQQAALSVPAAATDANALAAAHREALWLLVQQVARSLVGR